MEKVKRHRVLGRCKEGSFVMASSRQGGAIQRLLQNKSGGSGGRRESQAEESDSPTEGSKLGRRLGRKSTFGRSGSLR